MTKDTQELLNILAELPNSSAQEYEQQLVINKINAAINIKELNEISADDLRTAYIYINDVFPHIAKRARTFMDLICNVPSIPSHTATFI